MNQNASLTLTDLRAKIRDIPDYPKPGILFKDITPLLRDIRAFRQAVDQMAGPFAQQSVDVVVAAEARGFIFAAPIALRLNAGFVPIRKPGKLPYERHSFRYDLEYGSDTLEMHIDGVNANDRVLVVDDLLATGGTVGACCEMVRRCGATIVGCAFLVELGFLKGAEKLAPCPVYSVIKFDE
jgi:adenine phosphoribosyltransferase